MGRWVIVVDWKGLNGVARRWRRRRREGEGEEVKKEARVVSELRVRNFKLRSPRG